VHATVSEEKEGRFEKAFDYYRGRLERKEERPDKRIGGEQTQHILTSD